LQFLVFLGSKLPLISQSNSDIH